KNARSFAAYTGFTPAHSGTGGKNKIAHMSDNGNPVLKALIYEGANACTIIQKYKNKKDKRVKIRYGRHIAIDLWKIGINLKNPDIKEIVSHYDAELASKIVTGNFLPPNLIP
ncbi:MAG: transposase, partial [Succinivibrio sp.]|nr:transposase [Succinivibrio sp.]